MRFKVVEICLNRGVNEMENMGVMSKREVLGNFSGVNAVVDGVLYGYTEGFGIYVRELRAEVAIVLGHVMGLKREGTVLSVKDCAMLLRFGMDRRVGNVVEVDFNVYMGISARCMDVVRSMK